MKTSGLIKDYKPLPGEHCESAAILNALLFLNYEINEEQIIGSGAAPGFVYEKSEFPFLGGRSHIMRESFSKNCKIPYIIHNQENISDWKNIEDCINSEIPVVLRVDMRYLPYLYNGKYGPAYMSFGWHYITLFDIDMNKKVAKVCDTALPDLQSIRLSALIKARFSDTIIYPPKGEYYYFRRPEPGFSINWIEVTNLSLMQYYQNMNLQSDKANQLTGLTGLKQLSIETRELTEYAPSFLVRLVLDVHYGSIETNGTGGAAFRAMYYRFLKKNLQSENREGILKKAKKCEQSWHNLADSYKEGAILYKNGNKAEKKEVLIRISDYVEKVYTAEYEMNEIIRETYKL